MTLPIAAFLGKSAVFNLQIIDLPDAVEHALRYKYSTFSSDFSRENRDKVVPLVIKSAARSQESCHDIIQALLYGMLTDSSEAPWVIGSLSLFLIVLALSITSIT